jgi:hypothetical protein
VERAVRGAPVGQEHLERDPEQEGQARSVQAILHTGYLQLAAALLPRSQDHDTPMPDPI